MTSKKTIEKRLEKLAQAISPDETLIENVMSRINTKSIAIPFTVISQNIWRTIMKSPITKLATAAVIIIAAVLLITILDKSATPAYALEHTIEAGRSIRYIHPI